jgi:integrase
MAASSSRIRSRSWTVPPHRREAPRQVPGPELMDALVEAAKRRRRPRDLAIFLIFRYTGLRRESVARLQVEHLDPRWGLRGVRVKGGKTMDVPLPSMVMQFLTTYVRIPPAVKRVADGDCCALLLRLCSGAQPRSVSSHCSGVRRRRALCHRRTSLLPRATMRPVSRETTPGVERKGSSSMPSSAWQAGGIP